MKTAPNTEDIKARFAEWLKSPDVKSFIFPDGGSHNFVIRVKKDKDFDYLYCQTDYRGEGIQRDEKFNYAGLYCKGDGLIYDGRYALRDLIGEPVRGEADLLENLRDRVREAVEAIIANDRRNLTMLELSKNEIENIAHHGKWCAATTARRAYLDGDDGSFPFRCHYIPAPWSDNALINYIKDPLAYAQAEALSYIAKSQRYMLKTFLADDASREEYRAIIKNPQHQVHYVKRIIEAISGTVAKTYRVTIKKDGIELTFKVEADELRYDRESYDSYYITAADRQEFERLFGGRSNYYPQEITRIEYGRAILYEADGAKD